MTVGVLGFGVQIAAFAALTSMRRWSWLSATILAVELAVLHNFVWHERWTWPDSQAGRNDIVGRIGRLVRFNITTGATSITGNAIVMALFVGALGLPAVAGSMLAVAAMSAVNFIVSDAWVFQSRTGAMRGSARRSADRTEDCMVPVNTLQTRRNHRWQAGRPLRTWLVRLLATVVTGCASSEVQAGPAPQTIAAWDRYVAQIEARIERERLSPPLMAAGTEPAGESINVPAGTISRWRGSVLLPGVSLDQVLHRLQYPGTPPPQEDVAAARVLSRGPDSLRIYIRLVRTAFMTVTYDTEHEMWFRRFGPTLATARSISTRIDEVGDDHGFLWRLNSYWRYRQTADGVVVELESLTLSRRIPAAIRPIAAPIVTRIARESTVRTLEALRLEFTAER